MRRHSRRAPWHGGRRVVRRQPCTTRSRRRGGGVRAACAGGESAGAAALSRPARAVAGASCRNTSRGRRGSTSGRLPVVGRRAPAPAPVRHRRRPSPRRAARAATPRPPRGPFQVPQLLQRAEARRRHEYEKGFCIVVTRSSVRRAPVPDRNIDGRPPCARRPWPRPPARGWPVGVVLQQRISAASRAGWRRCGAGRAAGCAGAHWGPAPRPAPPARRRARRAAARSRSSCRRPSSRTRSPSSRAPASSSPAACAPWRRRPRRGASRRGSARRSHLRARGDQLASLTCAPCGAAIASCARIFQSVSSDGGRVARVRLRARLACRSTCTPPRVEALGERPSPAAGRCCASSGSASGRGSGCRADVAVARGIHQRAMSAGGGCEALQGQRGFLRRGRRVVSARAPLVAGPCANERGRRRADRQRGAEQAAAGRPARRGTGREVTHGGPSAGRRRKRGAGGRAEM